MESQKKLTRQVWRNNRSKITFSAPRHSQGYQEHRRRRATSDEYRCRRGALCRFKGSWSDGLTHRGRTLGRVRSLMRFFMLAWLRCRSSEGWGGSTQAPPSIHKVVSRICAYMPPLILHSQTPSK